MKRIIAVGMTAMAAVCAEAKVATGVPFSDGKFAPAKLLNAVDGKGNVTGRELIVAADGVDNPCQLKFLATSPWTGALYSSDSALPLGCFEIDARTAVCTLQCSAVNFVVRADVMEHDFAIHNLYTEDDAVGVVDADGLKSLETPCERVKPQRRLERVGFKLLEHFIHPELKVGMFADKAFVCALEFRSPAKSKLRHGSIFFVDSALQVGNQIAGAAAEIVSCFVFFDGTLSRFDKSLVAHALEFVGEHDDIFGGVVADDPDRAVGKALVHDTHSAPLDFLCRESNRHDRLLSGAKFGAQYSTFCPGLSRQSPILPRRTKSNSPQAPSEFGWPQKPGFWHQPNPDGHFDADFWSRRNSDGHFVS